MSIDTDNVGGKVDGTSPDATKPNARPGRRRKLLLIGMAAALGVVAVGGATAASMAKHVTITVDGQDMHITTLSGSVAGALDTAGLSAGEHDVLAPAADTSISDGSQIALERARQLTVSINGTTQQIWTTADTVEQALVQLGQDPSGLALSADRSRPIPLTGMDLVATTMHTVSITDGTGAATTVQTGGVNVGDVLNIQGIAIGPTDLIDPAPDTPVTDGTAITLTRIAVTTSTEIVDVAPSDQPVDDPNLDRGTTQVAVAGTPGKQEVVTQVTTTNGVETGRQELSRTTLVEPTPNQVHVGSKSTLDWQGSRVFFHDTEFGVNWDGLAFCESTNNPHAVNNPAGYLSTYGLFQFDLPTWASVGGSGNPGDASPEEQLTRAKLLYQSRGLEPWLCAYAASGPPAG